VHALLSIAWNHMRMEKEIFEALAQAEQREQSVPETASMVVRIRRLIVALIHGSIDAGRAAIEEVRGLDWKEEGKVLLIEFIRGLIAKALLSAAAA
jgi:hypothetical protein